MGNDVFLLTLYGFHCNMISFHQFYRTCHVQKMFFDIENLKTQAFTIEFDKIDTVGPDNVAFDPYREITDAFKALPSGLPFLRSFLSDPKSYIEPLSDA